MNHLAYLLAAPLVAVAFASADATETKSLADRFAEVMDQPAYRSARWGVLVVDAESGQTVYEFNPDRLCTPASVTKLFSCSAAMAEFGMEYRFETPVFARGRITNERLSGDLILRASGDLTMGGRTDADGHCTFTDNDHTYASPISNNTTLTKTDPLAGLSELARQVAEGGVKSVSGEVLIDDRLFAPERGTGSGPDRLVPIVINDNVVDVIVTPGAKPGDAPTVKLRPETDWVQADVEVRTVESSRVPYVDVIPVGPQRFAVRGVVPAGGKPAVRIWPVDDPVGFARALFIGELRKHGVAVNTSPLRPPVGTPPEDSEYENLKRLAVFQSPPFSELLKVTLKVSHNLYASTLPVLIAAKHDEKTLAQGLRRQGQFLRSVGVDTAAISFAGGAGGAQADAVTARATVALLRGLAKRPDYDKFRACLPILGVDGTLAEAVSADSPARGQARAKTGTLSWTDLLNNRTLLRSKALAGELTTASGRRLVFAIFLNDIPLAPGVLPASEGKTLGKLCEILYQHGGT